MDISKIKLIIWDLDETLWQGVLSEETVSLDPLTIRLLHNVTDAGVICSICSKNDLQTVKEFLEKEGIYDLFVFCSVNWSAKGERVYEIISEMQLRAQNVLFIDDNPVNLREAKKYSPDIMTSGPDIISELCEYFDKVEKTDKQRKRLNQYKLLEKKKEFRASVGSNEEFLKSCNIQVRLHKDCKENLDRIAELVMRSNQLNFTKIRSTKQQLLQLFEDDTVQCGYVSVSDSFGDYGIVGFYALKDGRLLHFVFSCRTLNMGVEQYVYNILSRPLLEVVGEVASSPFDAMPDYINQTENSIKTDKKEISDVKILFKGPCDLSQVFSFIKENDNILTEFVYVNDKGVSIESGVHTEHIVQSLTISNEDKNRLASVLPFGDIRMYDTAMFDKDVGAVYLSLFTDPNLALYREKSSGITVAFGEWTDNLTDEKNFQNFIDGKLFTSGAVFDRQSLEYIKENFVYEGRMTPERIVKNLDVIYKNLNKNAKLLLNVGSTIEHIDNTQKAYKNRHIYHKELAKLVYEWKKDKDRVYIIDATDFVLSQSDYTNNINHFVKPVYYKMAKAISDIVCDDSLKVLRHRKRKLVKRTINFIKRKLAKFI